jgi:hypothetical protein
MECLDVADNSSSISQSKAAALDPDPFVRAHPIERLVPTKAATGMAGHVLLTASGSKPNGSFLFGNVSPMLHGDIAISLR